MGNKTELLPPDTKATDEKSTRFLEFIRAYNIAGPEQYEELADAVKRLKVLEEEIKSTFADPKEKAWVAHKSICAAEAEKLVPVHEARQIGGRKLAAWNQEQERIRRIREAEAQAKALKLEQDRRLAEATALEKAGQKLEAEKLLSAPIEAPMTLVQSETPEVDGLAFATSWKYEVIDFEALIRFVAADLKRWSFLLQPNKAELNRFAKATKNTTPIAGVRIWSETEPRVSA